MARTKKIIEDNQVVEQIEPTLDEVIDLKDLADRKKARKDKRRYDKIKTESAYYHSESVWGYFNKNSNYAFLVIIGPRKCGKTYVAAEHFLKDWTKCHDNVLYYFRLTEAQKEKLLANNAEKMFDPPLVRKYFTNKGLILGTHSNGVYAHRVKKDKNGKELISKEMWKVAEAGALSTFYADKGTATYDFEFLKSDKRHRYWVIVDEFEKELGERSQGDMSYQFVNALHNKIRTTNKRTRVIMLCNNLRESSEILSGCFNFMPINYGLFKLKSKKCIIHYYNPPKSYWNMMNKGFTNRLVNDDDTTFLNEFKFDMSLITKQRKNKPTYIIRFSKSDEDCFIVWDSKIITKFTKTNANIKLPNVQNIPMVRFTDHIFDKKQQTTIFEMFDQRYYKYDSLMTKTQFESYIKKIRPNK